MSLKSRFQCSVVAVLVVATLPTGTRAQPSLGSGQLRVTGSQLTVAPESQTVPQGIATEVTTAWLGDVATATQGLYRVVGDLSGPEINGTLRLETVPGQPFRIPALTMEGQYSLDNIRLLAGDDFVAWASPRSSALLVTQILVGRVESRPLSLDEIRSHGIVIQDDSFQAFNFTFGFAVGGEVVNYEIPVFYGVYGANAAFEPLVLSGGGLGSSTSTASARFVPPRIAPFTLELPAVASGRGSVPATGGCRPTPEGDCLRGSFIGLPGAIVFPTDASVLNKFFSVVVLAQNAAPEGDPLVLRDLFARVKLPPGLRAATTQPPTPIGAPLPIRVPGPDGALGTADDLTFLVAQATGEAEVLLEGLAEGTHIVEFELDGVLEGLPTGLHRVSGTAKGAVLVRNPSFDVTISHPETVRTDEEYSLYLTVSNTGLEPVHFVELSLPVPGLSGVEVIGDRDHTLDELAPGDSSVVEFRLRSLRTGRIVATSVRTGTEVSPRFELTVGVGDSGVPLSPASLILPSLTEALPPEIVRHALGLLGLGYSLSAVPSVDSNPDLPRVSELEVREVLYWLAQAGRHVGLGESILDSVAVLAAEWNGARYGHASWDELRRMTERGGSFSEAVAGVLATGGSPRDVLERIGSATAFLPESPAWIAVSGAQLRVTSLASNGSVSGRGSSPQRVRSLSYADLYRWDNEELVVLARPGLGEHEVEIFSASGGLANLELLLGGADGNRRRLHWLGVDLDAGGRAVVEIAASSSEFILWIDREGDGFFESSQVRAAEVLPTPPFEVVGAVQNAVIDPSGHVVEVLFNQDIGHTSLLPRDPSRFEIEGKLSNGGLNPQEESYSSLLGGNEITNPFEGLRNTRVVRVVFDNPLSPYRDNDLTITGVSSASGIDVSPTTMRVTTTVDTPGTVVEGRVIGPDGQPVPFATVALQEVDGDAFTGTCGFHTTAATRTNADGWFQFDYVRATSCSDTFTLIAQDPLTSLFGRARARVRFIGQTMELNIVMLGRGTVRGHLGYVDGSAVDTPSVFASSPAFSESLTGSVDEYGNYEIRNVPVGTVTLGASDGDGNFVLQTVEVPVAGASVNRDLVIIRRPDQATADARGTVVRAVDQTPVHSAYVALYVDSRLMGVRRSGLDGGFDFGTVPTGIAEIEAFDGVTGRSGAQLLVTIEPDQVYDLSVPLRDDRGTIEGFVSRVEGDEALPVAGAIVWASGTPFNTLTDETGFYQLADVFAGTRTVLAADGDRGVQVSARVTVGAGVVVRQDLSFLEQSEPTVGGISGVFLDEAGIPIAGAIVHLSSGPYRWFHQAMTDISGQFHLPDLSPGSYRVQASRGQDGAFGTARVQFQGHTASVTLQVQRGTIRGVTRALSGGTPVGLRSLVTYRTAAVTEYETVELDNVVRTIETDEDGNFELPNVLVGPYVLTVSNAFHGEKTVRSDLIFHGQVKDHDFLFEQNGEIRGVVYDYDGVTPAAGATVRLGHPDFAAYDVTTDASGAFSFALVPPAGKMSIDVDYHSGTVFRTAQVWVRMSRFGQELDVEVHLPAQGSVVGWVESASGEPAPGAVVTLREGGYPRRMIVRNTDEEGYFRFDNVFAGEVGVSAQAPSLGGLGGRTSTEISFEGEEVYTQVVLEEVGEIVGVVVHPVTETPVPFAEVVLRGWSARFVDTVSSDAAGEFRFRLLPLGVYRVDVLDAVTGRFGRVEGIEIAYNEQVEEIVCVLEVRGEVEGYLLDPDVGQGVPAATVRLRTQSNHSITTYSSTDASGYFEFLGVPEGTFGLFAEEPLGRRRANGDGAVAGEGERVHVDLSFQSTGRVVGAVLPPIGSGETPWSQANTLLLQRGQVVGATLSNPFVFEGVIEGESFELSSRSSFSNHQAQAFGQIPPGESEATVELRMEPIGSVRVLVVDGSDNPRSGVNVTLRSRGFYGRDYFYGTTTLNGTVDFTEVGAGKITVWVTDPVNGLSGSGSGRLENEVQILEVSVALQDTGTVRGRVLSEDGISPAEGALVVLDGSRDLETETDELGNFEFPVVVLGSFQVFATEENGPGFRRVASQVGSNGDVVDLGDLVLDTADPMVLAITPSLGTRDVPLSTQVVVEFDEPIDRDRWSGNWVTFQTLSGHGVGYDEAWSPDQRTLTVTPHASLDNFTTYDFVVNPSVVDLAGRFLSSRVGTSFSTVDSLPPALIDVIPGHGAIEVDVASNILLTFSEPVALASLSGTSLQLADVSVGTGLATTFSLLAGEQMVLLTPTQALSPDREYRVTVQGVSDLIGNTMIAPVSTSFWTTDTLPPSLGVLSPPGGASFVSGALVPFSLTAEDPSGIDRVSVSRLGWAVTEASGSLELETIAPLVTESTSVDFLVEVWDSVGNRASVTHSLSIEPRPDDIAPSVIAGDCLPDGTWIAPGDPVPLRFAISDDQLIESYRLTINGEALLEELQIRDSAALVEVDWTPPVHAQPGEGFEVVLTARDYGGNEVTESLSLHIPEGLLLQGTRLLNGDYSAQSIFLGAGVFRVPETRHFGSLTLLHGAVLLPIGGTSLIDVSGDLAVQCGGAVDLTPEEVWDRSQEITIEAVRLVAEGQIRGSSTVGGEVRLTVSADEVLIGTTGAIDVSGLGYAGGTGSAPVGAAPDWVAAAQPDTGGSHGGIGQGRDEPTLGAEVFDSIYWPVLGGGGGSEHGGAGGGVLILEATHILVDGAIRARGSQGGPSGAGGSIQILAETLSGSGTIDASGGYGEKRFQHFGNGSGGGGRVLVTAQLTDGFDPASQVLVFGGETEGRVLAAPGTLLLVGPEETWGRLIVNGGSSRSPTLDVVPTELTELGAGDVVTAGSLGADLVLVGEEPFRPRWVGATVELLGPSGEAIGTFLVRSVDAEGRAIVEGGAGLAPVSYRGLYRFDTVEIVGGASLIASDEVQTSETVIDGDTEVFGVLMGQSIVIRAGATVRPAEGDSLEIIASERLVVESGAVIDVSGMGFPGSDDGSGGAPEWVASADGDTGGSHGGGGLAYDTATLGAEVFDSVFRPSLGGGGGGENGGAGGGILRIQAPELILDGELLAQGARGGPSGAGGTIVVDTDLLSGAGLIDASGGLGDKYEIHRGHGPGGGGRIVLRTELAAAFDPELQVRAFGGVREFSRIAAPGTILLFDDTSVYGRLLLNGGRGIVEDLPVEPTVLPELGSGAVVEILLTPEGLRISGPSPFRPRWLGATVELLDTDDVSLGTFLVESLDSGGRLLLPGAGDLTTVASYRGLYRFDAIDIVYGAGVVASDPVDAEDLILEGETQLEGELVGASILVRSGAVVTPASGESIRIRALTSLVIEEGAVLDVSGRGYPQGMAPEWIESALDDSGGSHGGAGLAWNEPVEGPEVYDSVYYPSLSGSGGSSPFGIAGGGIVELESPSIVLDGQILAKGARAGPAGAGGSVLIRADLLEGIGTIDASGGLGAKYAQREGHGAGGGGRIAIYADLHPGFSLLDQVSVLGGQRERTMVAGAGTLLVRGSDSTFGDLTIVGGSSANDDLPVLSTRLPTLGGGSISEVQHAGADLWIRTNSEFRPRWLGTTVELFDDEGSSLGSFVAIELDQAGRLLLEGASGLLPVAYNGTYRFDSVFLKDGAGLESASEVWAEDLILEGSVTLDVPLSGDRVFVRGNATVQPKVGGLLEFHASERIETEPGSRLTVIGLGYGSENDPIGGAPATVAGAVPDTGGSHGGGGLAFNTEEDGVEVFDSVFLPRLGGGSGSEGGGAGGGVVHLAAPILQLDGLIQANGARGGPSGAGGTVLLEAEQIAGTGIIEAFGGFGNKYSIHGGHGAGGGGRVAIYGELEEGFDPQSQVLVFGGELDRREFAAPGTLYLKDDLAPFGTLIVDGANERAPSYPVATTDLPSIYKGTIGAVEVREDGLWVGLSEASPAVSLGVTGQWIRVHDQDYRVLSEDPDRRGLLLEGASSSEIQPGAPYLGIYRFDRVVVRGGATLRFRDADVVDLYEVQGGSQVVHLDLIPPDVVVLGPAEGSEFTSGEMVQFEILVTDNEALADVHLTFGDRSTTLTEAPFSWSVPAPVVSNAGPQLLEITARDAENNVAVLTHSLQILPLAPGDPPQLAVLCPSPTGGLVAPGSVLDVLVAASHDEGIERVELLLDEDPVPVAVDFEAPFQPRLEVPIGTTTGTSIEVKVRARSFTGTATTSSIFLEVIHGQLVTPGTVLAAGDASLDGESIVFPPGTFTIDGSHTFEDLVVLDGASVSHSATTVGLEGQLELAVTGRLFVACGGSIDGSGRGYPSGYSYPNSDLGGASSGVGGSHGGRGGGFDGSGRVYGSLVDPTDPGAGGGGTGSSGGGVVRIQVAGEATIDGQILADGSSAGTGPHGAGGSVRVDAMVLSGVGSISARGGGVASSGQIGGGGGRIALYASAIDESLLSRVQVSGGPSIDSDASGAAGTLFTKLDSQTFGELRIDNGSVVSSQWTEIPAVGSGLVSEVTISGFRDTLASFVHDLRGREVSFNGNDSQLWGILEHQHLGDALELDLTSSLTAVPGDPYQGVLRLDRLVVSGSSRASTAERIEGQILVEPSAELELVVQPTISMVRPQPGSIFLAGETISVEVDAVSTLGIRAVYASVAGATGTMETSPYLWQVTAPPVVSVSDLEVYVEVEELSGRRHVLSTTIEVRPLSDSSAPSIQLGACPRDGDLVMPGSSHEVSFAIQDDESIERYEVWLDGGLVEVVDQIAQPEVAGSYELAVPAGSSHGTVHQVEIVAYDYAGGSSTQILTLESVSDGVLMGTADIGTEWEHQSLVLGTGTFTLTSSVEFENLSLLAGAVVVGTSAHHGIDLGVSGTLRAQCGSVLDASDEGYSGATSSSAPGEAPLGLQGPTRDFGGSHGGLGAESSYSGQQGETYGSVYLPQLPGGGGAWSRRRGGEGGGVLDLSVGTLVLDGILRSSARVQGEINAVAGGGGAGGSIVVEASSLTGSGLIDASGGESRGCYRKTGVGGGGRVALYVEDLTTFDPTTQVDVRGGGVSNCDGSSWLDRYAGSGTVYVKTPWMPYGDLIVGNGLRDDGSERPGPATQLPSLGAGEVIEVESIGDDLWVAAGESFRDRWVGAWMRLLDLDAQLVGAYRVVGLDPQGRVRLEGAGGVVAAVSYEGEYRFDSTTALHGTELFIPGRLVSDLLDVRAGELRLPEMVEVEQLTIRDGAVAASGQPYLRLVVTDTLTIETGGLLDASDEGYSGATSSSAPGEAPLGLQGPTRDFGGSHGGLGAESSYSGQQGETYGSVYLPQLPGGGGAWSRTRGGEGGGVLDLSVGTLVLDGILRSSARVQGEINAVAGGGGAGGSIVVEASSLTGSGSIDASGGESRGCYNKTGVGGGGRVALYVEDLTTFDPTTQVDVRGGGVSNCDGSSWLDRYAGSGTVYVKTPWMPYGDLIVGNGLRDDGSERPGPATQLPPLGEGAVIEVEPIGDDLWVAAVESFRERWIGAWMRLLDLDAQLVGTYRVVGLDPQGRVRLEGAGGSVAAVSYEGEYRFDSTTALHGTELFIPGRLVSDLLDVRAGELRLPEMVEVEQLTIRDGAVAASGHPYLRLVVSDTLTIETGGLLDASDEGYLGATSSSAPGESPPNSQGPTRDYGGSHGGLGAKSSYSGQQGEIYGSVYLPQLPGGGGAWSRTRGGEGGGVLDLSVDTLVLDGILRSSARVQGEINAVAGGGGAGGSIVVEASSLTGSGSIDASGGESRGCYNLTGVGGGGRVALYVEDLTTFDPTTQVDVRGGGVSNCDGSSWLDRYAGAGTVYVETDEIPGALFVHQAGFPASAPTKLPRIGGGMIASVTADLQDPTAAWLDVVDPNFRFGVGIQGAWLRIAGTDYRILGQTEDRLSVLLANGASLLPGEEFLGVYKFSDVEVRGGAVLVIDDDSEIDTIFVDPDSQLIRNGNP